MRAAPSCNLGKVARAWRPRQPGASPERAMSKGKKLQRSLLKTGGEVLRDVKEKAGRERQWHVLGDGRPPRPPRQKYHYVDELARLQFELLKLQEWVRLRGPQG